MNYMFFGNARIMLFNSNSSPAPGPAGHDDTRFTLQGGTVETHNITETLNQQWMKTNGYFNSDEKYWIKKIEHADIGNTVMSIGSWTFWFCDSLISVIIGNNVQSIGSDSFEDCYALKSITIPDSIESIGFDAFTNSSNLTTVTIVATGKPGASAASVKQMMIDAGVPSSITWNMPS